jgi:predicted dithiol-disulfide oxidoreductase (DUF899 family)
MNHRVVDHDEWLAARRELLTAEKEFTHRRDALSRARRELPWERVENEYVFATPSGEKTLSELFECRSQLIVYHFMFNPDDDWTEACKHCSFWADSFDPNVVHLQARDVTLVAVSRAQIEKIERYRARMGWTFTWVSSYDSDFNYAFGVSFREDERDQPVFNFGTIVPGFRPRAMPHDNVPGRTANLLLESLGKPSGRGSSQYAPAARGREGKGGYQTSYWYCGKHASRPARSSQGRSAGCNAPRGSRSACPPGLSRARRARRPVTADSYAPPSGVRTRSSWSPDPAGVAARHWASSTPTALRPASSGIALRCCWPTASAASTATLAAAPAAGRTGGRCSAA